MYNKFYGLKEKPFQNDHLSKFFWKGKQYTETLHHLVYGATSHKGLMLLTGDIGTGKTCLSKSLVKLVAPTTESAYIYDPRLKDIDLLQFILHSYGIKKNFASRSRFLNIFESHLINLRESDKNVLLVIDEAQNMSAGLLELCQHLSNLEYNYLKLLNILFVGQKQIRDLLAEPAKRALRQRIAIAHHLLPLTREETDLYITFRLRVAGRSRDLFSIGALKTIYHLTQGIPHTINALCDLALMYGCKANDQTILSSRIQQCGQLLELSPRLNKMTASEKDNFQEPQQPLKSIAVAWRKFNFTLFIFITAVIGLVFILLY